MKRIVALLLVAALAFADAGSGAEVTLRVGNNQPEASPWNIALRHMRDLIAKYSNNRVELVIYPNATLGAEPELAESCKEGTLDIYVGDPPVGTTFCRELELFSLPFLFRDYDHWKKALDGEPGRKYSRLIEEKTGMRIVGYWGGSSRNVIAVKKPVTSISDLKGFKLRLAPSQLKFQIWEAIGALPVTIAFGETYSAMASGLCDGMENEPPAILINKLYEPASYMTATEHEITVRPMFVNAKVLDGLAPDLREAFMKAAAEATEFARKTEQEIGVGAIKQMTGQFGVTISAINKQPIIDAIADVFKKFGENTGLTELIKEFMDFK